VSCVSGVIMFFIHLTFVAFDLWFLTQSADGEMLVRDVLYDALILVDYSFINNEVGVDQADSSLLHTFVSRLIITHDAINEAR
jgi:hypothetical protein